MIRYINDRTDFIKYVNEMPIDENQYVDGWQEIVAEKLYQLCKEKGFTYGNNMPGLTDGEFWKCFESAEKSDDFVKFIPSEIKYKYLYVFEAINDTAAKEYFDTNIKSIESVQEYASEACDIYLSRVEAQFIRMMLLKYKSMIEKEGLIDSNDYYHEFQVVLESAEEQN